MEKSLKKNIMFLFYKLYENFLHLCINSLALLSLILFIEDISFMFSVNK